MPRKKVQAPSPTGLGLEGGVITPSDTVDLADDPKGIQVSSVSGGDVLQILPVNNAENEWLTFTGVQVGFVPVFVVRRVGVATTCTCVSVKD